MALKIVTIQSKSHFTAKLYVDGKLSLTLEDDEAQGALKAIKTLQTYKKLSGVKISHVDEIPKDEKRLWWYAFRYRGLSLGCQPKDFVDHDESYGRFGSVAYERPLRDEEIEQYELEAIEVK